VRWAGGSLEVCSADDPDLLVHDAGADDPTAAFALSRLTGESAGVTPIGVFRNVDRPAYDELMNAQVQAAIDKQGPGDVNALLRSGDTWTVD
jgi:2-oxoglutarate ferredoxin oxidoreductase subunit beta